MSADYQTWRGDSRELFRKVPDRSVDLICTDPPYNLGTYSTGNIKLSWRSDFNNDIATWDTEPFDPSEWLAEFRRVLKPTGNIFAFTSYNLLGRWHDAFDPAFDTFQFVVWHKTNPPPKLYRAGFLNSCELIVAAWNKGHVWNFTRQAEMHNFIESPICAGKERLKDPKHPTQKPVAVLRQLIGLASRPGDLVLDPFMGVGSTGVAALELGRHFVGMEIDEAYHTAANRRLASTTPSMFTDALAGDWAYAAPPESPALHANGADSWPAVHRPADETSRARLGRNGATRFSATDLGWHDLEFPSDLGEDLDESRER